MRELVSFCNDGSYLTGTAPANLPTTAAVTGETYAEVDWPVDAVGIYGVRVLSTTGTGKWYPLKRIPFQAYQDFQYDGLLSAFSPTQGPRAYTPRTLPDASGTTETAGKVMITPVPRGGQYRLWYLQAWAPRTGDTNIFPGIAAFTEWAIWNTLIKMLSPDNDSDNNRTTWVGEREICRQRIEERARTMDQGGSVEPRDARGDGWDYDPRNADW